MTRGVVIWRAAPLIAAFVVGAFIVVLVIASALPARYSDSARVRLQLNTTQGPSQDSSTAANQLASQYTQLIDTNDALGLAATSMGMELGDLEDKISAGTVQDQNVIQVTATDDDRERTTEIANAAAESFAAFVRRDSGLRALSYSREVSIRLRPLDREIASARRRTRARNDAIALNAQIELSGLVGQKQKVIADLAARSVAGQVLADIPERADGASKTFPRPLLFAIVAGLIALLAAMQVALARERSGLP